ICVKCISILIYFYFYSLFS
ncbi:hypothetical protein, partial [Plasmodium yoelii yoelii]